jgi:hypothetical protein
MAVTETLIRLHAMALAMAGESFDWTAPNGATIGSRPRSDAMPGLTAWLIACQGGICAACGEALDGTERIEVCHIVRGRERGYVPGNLYAGHTSCNDIDSKVYGAIVPLTSLVRADLVPTVPLPGHSTLKGMGSTDARRARRLAIRQASHRAG